MTEDKFKKANDLKRELSQLKYLRLFCSEKISDDSELSKETRKILIDGLQLIFDTQKARVQREFEKL